MLLSLFCFLTLLFEVMLCSDRIRIDLLFCCLLRVVFSLFVSFPLLLFFFSSPLFSNLFCQHSKSGWLFGPRTYRTAKSIINFSKYMSNDVAVGVLCRTPSPGCFWHQREPGAETLHVLRPQSDVGQPWKSRTFTCKETTNE